MREEAKTFTPDQMRLHEVMDYGLPFRRNKWQEGVYTDREGIFKAKTLTVEDALARDWQVV